MFSRFHAQVFGWIEKQGYGPRLERLTPPQRGIELSEAVLWRAYLAAALPPAARDCLDLDWDPLAPLVRSLSELNEFATEAQLNRIVIESPLGLLLPEEQARLGLRLAAFKNQLNRWHRGVLHRAVNADPFGALSELNEQLKLDDLWETARLLARTGFGYPHSRASARAFARFGGDDEADYRAWFEALGARTNLARAYQTDRTLELIFGERNPFYLPHLCAPRPLCPSCFLQGQCRYYRDQYGEEGLLPLENQLKLGRADQLENRELLLYLAGDRWQNRPRQNKWLAQFDRGEIEPDLIRPGDEPEEVEFLLFTRALEEAGHRMSKARRKRTGQAVASSQDIFEQYRFKLGREKQESFHVAILDNRYRPMSLQMISRGLLDQTLVHPREVFAPALHLQAAAVILIHNHPSGDVQPSKQDLSITKRLCEVGKLVGIKVLDHVIISEESYFSFADENLLPTV